MRRLWNPPSVDSPPSVKFRVAFYNGNQHHWGDYDWWQRLWSDASCQLTIRTVTNIVRCDSNDGNIQIVHAASNPDVIALFSEGYKIYSSNEKTTSTHRCVSDLTWWSSLNIRIYLNIQSVGTRRKTQICCIFMYVCINSVDIAINIQQTCLSLHNTQFYHFNNS